MRRVLVALLAVAALARGASAAPADDALAAVKTDEQRAHDLTARKQAEAARYQQQLAAIDDLKRQRASWRRDRQLQAALADSLETAKQLAATADAITASDAELARARGAAVAAIDLELSASPDDARRAALVTARAREAGALAAAHPKKIVLPDDTLDPLADPEELDQQAAALADGEAALARESDSLAKQAVRFAKQAELLRQHQRADDLATRDDSEPRRSSAASTTSAVDGARQPGPQTGAGAGSGGPTDNVGPGSGGGATPSFEGQPDFVLADVIDGAAIDGLRRAGRGGDPAAKAAAATAARDQVEARLKRLRERRAAIEARARELRR